MITITTLAAELGVDPADLAIIVATDPTGTYYGTPTGDTIEVSDGFVDDLVLTTEAVEVLTEAAAHMEVAP